ncbi:MAG: hypothetical protein ABUK15_07490, partial [Anaerolineales bacterium]
SGMHARGLWGTYHPELVEGPLPSRSTAWSTPPGSNVELSDQTYYLIQAGLTSPMKRKPE